MDKLTETRGYSLQLTEAEANTLMNILLLFNDDTLEDVYNALDRRVELKRQNFSACTEPNLAWGKLVFIERSDNENSAGIEETIVNGLGEEVARVDDRISIDDLKDPKRLYGKG